MFLLDVLNRKILYNNPIKDSYTEKFRIIIGCAASSSRVGSCLKFTHSNSR
jgi:hypothetical protein